MWCLSNFQDNLNGVDLHSSVWVTIVHVHVSVQTCRMERINEIEKVETREMKAGKRNDWSIEEMLAEWMDKLLKSIKKCWRQPWPESIAKKNNNSAIRTNMRETRKCLISSPPPIRSSILREKFTHTSTCAMRRQLLLQK